MRVCVYVQNCVSNTWHVHVTEKEAETSLSTSDFTTHASTAVTNLSSPRYTSHDMTHDDLQDLWVNVETWEVILAVKVFCCTVGVTENQTVMIVTVIRWR